MLQRNMAGKKACGARTKTAAIVFAAAFALVSSVPFFIIGTDILGGKLHVDLSDWTRDFIPTVNDRIGGYDTGNVQPKSRSSPLPATLPAHVAKDFFFLNCPKTPLPQGTHRIALVYRVDVIQNWEDILRDQMHTLVTCGLGDRANSFDVLVSPGEPAEIEMVSAVLREYVGFIVTPQMIGIGTDNGQRGTLVGTDGKLGEICRRQALSSGGSNETIVFHFSNMGALAFHTDWRQHKSITDEGPYSRSLYWRKYAEWFLLERPQSCIDKILSGSWTCGVSVKTHEDNTLKYTPDDMWAASCNHLVTRVTPNSLVASAEGALLLGHGLRKHLDRQRHVELHKSKKDASKQLIYPEEYDESASRFRLMCPNDPFPEGNYKVAMGYHVGMINNWKEVVSDQLQTLSACGLGKKASTFLVSYSKGDPDELRDLVSNYNIAAKPKLINATKSPWECPMNTALRDFCKEATEPTIVFYFHNKGVSKYKADWRSRMDVRRTYGKSLYWRKLIEFFLIERPTLCVNKIQNGSSTCGLDIQGKHYSGNMWAASCEYLSKLPACDGTGYIDSELWLQQAMHTNSPLLYPNDYVELWNPLRVEGGTTDQLTNLYNHHALPEEYTKEAYLNRTRMKREAG